MNAADDPFAPGAGAPPPQLAGRDEVLRGAEVSLRRIVAGTPDRGHLLLGLRGVGKTVLLNRIAAHAVDAGYHTVELEASERGRLAEMLAPQFRAALVRMSRSERVKEIARQSLLTLRNFASAFNVTLGGSVEVGIEPGEGGADTGDLDLDLPDLLVSIGEVAKAGKSGLAILIDEVQYLSSAELSGLIRAIHRVTQKNLPVVLFGAGLPQLAGLAGEAQSYAERLFRYPKIDRLTEAAAAEAIVEPLRRKGVVITDEAVEGISLATGRYPYFLQEWGSHTWRAAAESPITLDDVHRATSDALLQLDNDFFRVRFDRLTPVEREYMRAMAELGEGPHASGAIAKAMGRTTNAVGPLRDSVISKGMAYSPQYGQTAFTVPMFDGFMRRIMPDWKAGERSGQPAAAGRRKKGKAP
jgi:hypothetical protein